MYLGPRCPSPLNRTQSAIGAGASSPPPPPPPPPPAGPPAVYTPVTGLRNASITYYQNRGWNSADQINKQSRFGFVTNGMYNMSVKPATVNAHILAVTQRNPNCWIAVYKIDYEEKPGTPGGNDYWYAQQKYVVDNNYWLRNTDGSQAQWNGSFNAKNIRLTGGKPGASPGGDGGSEVLDANGLLPIEGIAKLIWDGGPVPAGLTRDNTPVQAWIGFKNYSAINAIFRDNAWLQGQQDEVNNPATVNFFRDGVARKSSDAVVQAAFGRNLKRAHAKHRSAAGRAIRIYGNNLSKTNLSEVPNEFNGALLEDGVGGKSFAEEQASSRQFPWTITRLREAMANMLEPKTAIIGLRMGRELELQLVRYTIGQSLLQDKSMAAINCPALPDPSQTIWDEWNFPFGDRWGAIPTVGSAQVVDGMWTCEYNGVLVVVNPVNNGGKAIQSYNAAHYIRRTSGVVEMSGPAHGLTNGETFYTAGFQSAVALNGGPWTAQVVSATLVRWNSAGADGQQAADAGASVFGHICRQKTATIAGTGKLYPAGTWRHARASDPWWENEGAPRAGTGIYNGAVADTVTMLTGDARFLIRRSAFA